MITYLKGDATSPQAKGTKLIVHVCNTLGGWGKGFVLAISKRWGQPEAMYRRWYHQREPIQNTEPGEIVMTSGKFELGQTQLILVAPHLAVINMIAQQGMRTGSNGPPIRYDALEKCLGQVNGYADSFKASIHMPRIGCSLAGGRWSLVEPLIDKTLKDRAVFVYDFPGGRFNP
jgi:O-acetyl-ADP-ribose deacetylase (regulator of RNase III)